MKAGPKILRIYATASGRRPFQEWFDSLKDYAAKARILVRLDRIRLGNPGDSKTLGEGVCELRMDSGPGYRVYFGQDADSIVILLCGGTKRTQTRDIAMAKKFWADYRSTQNGT